MTARAIADDVERAVRSGRLGPGEPVPSIRKLAALRGISPATVHNAYGRLQQRGLLVSEGARGMRVSGRPPLLAGRPALRVPSDAIDLCNGNPDPALLPSLERGLAAAVPGRQLYGDATTFAPLLRHAAADFAASGIDAAHQVVLSGALDAIERILSVHLDPGDRVMVEDPTYAELLDLLRAMRLHPVGVPVDGEGPITEHASSAARTARAAVLTPRAHNPTSGAIGSARAAQLRGVFAAHPDLLVIENDHSALIAGGPHAAVATATRRWAVVRSLSKALLPDLRVAIMASDSATAALVEGRQLLGCGWVSHVLQCLALELWTAAIETSILQRATRVYADRRRALVDALAAHGIPARGETGLNVFIEVAEEGVLAQALLAAGWAVRTGEGYRLDSRGAFLRVTTATLEPADARRFAADLADAMSSGRHAKGG